MDLCLFESNGLTDYQPDEGPQASYWESLPKIGACIALGGQRIWQCVGRDYYCDAAHPEHGLYLYHCELSPIASRRSRRDWPSVKLNKRIPQTLHLFFSDREIIHTMISGEGQQCTKGLLLPQYQPNGEISYIESWEIDAVQVMHPKSHNSQLSFRAVVLSKCSYTSSAEERLMKAIGRGLDI